jgi:hypothetical protein
MIQIVIYNYTIELIYNKCCIKKITLIISSCETNTIFSTGVNKCKPIISSQHYARYLQLIRPLQAQQQTDLTTT